MGGPSTKEFKSISKSKSFKTFNFTRKSACLMWKCLSDKPKNWKLNFKTRNLTSLPRLQLWKIKLQSLMRFRPNLSHTLRNKTIWINLWGLKTRSSKAPSSLITWMPTANFIIGSLSSNANLWKETSTRKNSLGFWILQNKEHSFWQKSTRFYSKHIGRLRELKRSPYQQSLASRTFCLWMERS